MMYFVQKELMTSLFLLKICHIRHQGLKMAFSNHFLKPFVYGCETISDSAERLVSRSIVNPLLRPKSAAGSIHRSKSREGPLKRPEARRSQTDSNLRTVSPHIDAVPKSENEDPPSFASQLHSIVVSEAHTEVLCSSDTWNVRDTCITDNDASVEEERSSTSMSDSNPQSDNTNASDWSIIDDDERNKSQISDTITLQSDEISLLGLGLSDLKTKQVEYQSVRVSYPKVPKPESPQYTALEEHPAVARSAITVTQTDSPIQGDPSTPTSQEVEYWPTPNFGHISKQIKKKKRVSDTTETEDLRTWEEEMAIRRQKILLALQVREAISLKDRRMQNILVDICKEHRTVQDHAEDMIKEKTVDFMSQLSVELLEKEIVTAQSAIIALAKAEWNEDVAYQKLRADYLNNEKEHLDMKVAIRSALERARARE